MTTATSVDMGLARALTDAALTGASGIASCSRGKLKRIFCVNKGRLVFARSNLIEEQFTEILVNSERVAVAQMANARRRAQESQSNPLSLLLEEKHVIEEELDGWLVEHFTELFRQTMRWDDGEVEWTAGLPALGGHRTVSIDAGALISAHALGLRSISRKLRNVVGSPKITLSYNKERERLLGTFATTPLTAHCLTAASDNMTIETLLRSAPDSEDRCWAVLYALSLLGCIAPSVGSIEHTANRGELLARIELSERANHYRLLDVQTSASAEKVRAAYYALARDYHPDRYRSGALIDLRQQVEEYFIKVTEAYNTLINPELRKAYDLEQLEDETEKPEQDTAFLAQQNFRAASKLFERGRLNEAMKALQNAVKLDDRNAQYRLELGKLMSQNPRLRTDAEEQLLEVNRLDPSLIEGYIALGQLYARWNRPQEARTAFLEALNWEPGNLEATSAIKALGR